MLLSNYFREAGMRGRRSYFQVMQGINISHCGWSGRHNGTEGRGGIGRISVKRCVQGWRSGSSAQACSRDGGRMTKSCPVDQRA
jgi:hypothetical protein